MKTRSHVTAVAAVLVLIFFALSAGAFEDRVVAVVNDEIITLSELNEAFVPVLKRINADTRARGDKQIEEEARKALLDRMIRDVLISQEAARLSMAVGEKEIESYIAERIERNSMTKKGLIDTLAKENLTYEAYKETVKKEIMRMKLVRKEIRSKVAISDEDIGAYYQKHRDLYEGKEAVRIEQIVTLLPRDCDEETKTRLRERTEMVLEKLKAGERFDKLAREYSQDSASQVGGDLGFIEKGMILPDVEAAAFSLAKGEISGIIESPVGYHIIKVADKRGAGTKPLEEVREEIISQIGNERLETKFMEWLNELVEKSHIEIRL